MLLQSLAQPSSMQSLIGVGRTSPGVFFPSSVPPTHKVAENKGSGGKDWGRKKRKGRKERILTYLGDFKKSPVTTHTV